MTDAAWLVLRAAGFVLTLQAAGAVLFLACFGAKLVRGAPAVRRLARRTAAAALALCLVQCFAEAAHLGGEWSSLTDPALLRLVPASSAGVALLVRAAALACIAMGARRERAPAQVVALAGSLAALVSFLLTGHTSVGPERALLAPLLLAHLAVVAFWFGALWPLRQLATCESPQEVARTLAAFSRVALWLVPVIPLAGAALACLLLPGIQALGEPYGRLLGIKLALFALLMGLAALNKMRFTPALARGETRALAPLRRSLGAEYLLICVTLAVSAALSGLYAPSGSGS